MKPLDLGKLQEAIRVRSVETKTMNTPASICPVCGGQKSPGTTTFTADLGTGVVVVRHVRATVCSQCGEEWIDHDTAQRIEAIVAEARVKRLQVEVADLAA